MKFKDFFKEAEFDFGDEDQADTIDQTKLNARMSRDTEKEYSERRGFIGKDGTVIEIGPSTKIGHYGYAINNGFESVEDLLQKTGLVRWSPETYSLQVGRKMTPQQIDTTRSILAEYGYNNIDIEYTTKGGGYSSVSFSDGDGSNFDAKIGVVQRSVV